MKKLLPLCFLFVLSFSSFGQKLTLSLDAGYGFQMNPMSDGYGDRFINPVTPNIQRRELLRYSFGEGWNLGGILEYEINEILELGIGVSFLKGGKHQRMEINQLGDEKIDELYSTMLRIVPEAKFNIPLLNNYLFARFGLVIGAKGKIMEDLNVNEPDFFEQKVRSGGLSYGFLGGLGYEIALSENLFLAPEIRVYAQSFAPKFGETTIDRVKGVDMVSSLSNRNRYSEYVKSYEYTFGAGGIDNSEPRKYLKSFFPFNSAGLHLNLIFLYGR